MFSLRYLKIWVGGAILLLLCVCGLAAPLLAGNDLRSMSPAILAILTNREVIAVNQDKDGKQGTRVWKSGDQEIWTRPLSGGALAVALLRKGRSVEETANTSRVVYRSLGALDRDTFERLRTLRSQLARVSLAGPGALDAEG